MIFSEVAYYLDRADLARLVARVEGAVLPEADIVLVEGAGHLAHLEQPGAFNAALGQFLQGLPGDSASHG